MKELKRIADDQTEKCESWGALAIALGTTRRTLQSWRERFPHKWPPPKDGKHDVGQWRAFALDRGLRPARRYATPDPDPAGTQVQAPGSPVRMSLVDISLSAASLHVQPGLFTELQRPVVLAALSRILAEVEAIYDALGVTYDEDDK